MSKRGDLELLFDIKEAAKRIGKYVKNAKYDVFLKDIKTQDAVVRNLEIIGEASKNISESIKKENIKIPWKNLAGARDRLIHSYFGVNYDIVWAISKNELPEILPEIGDLIKKLEKEKVSRKEIS